MNTIKFVVVGLGAIGKDTHTWCWVHQGLS